MATNDTVEVKTQNNAEGESDVEVTESADTTEETKTESSQDKTRKEETPEARVARLKRQLDREERKLGIKKEEKSEPQSKPNELDYGQIALLRQEGIKGAGEMALFKEIMSETGKGVLDVLDSNYFKSRLSDFRTAQESANAIPKGKSRTGQTGSTDVDIAVAKYRETGELPSDFTTRNKVVDAITKAEKGELFSGPNFK